MKIGWIGVGRMGAADGGAAPQGRATRFRSGTGRGPRPSTEELKGADVVDRRDDLADVDVLFTMLYDRQGRDRRPLSDRKACSATVRARCRRCSSTARPSAWTSRPRSGPASTSSAWQFLAAPVSGNPKCIWAGKFCPAPSPARKAAFDTVEPLLLAIAPRGAAYAGEGELARMCKIAVNLLLAVINENMMEVTLLAQKAGVPRHAFLEFLNNSVIGSIFTRYKTPALVNLDFTTTFPPTGQRKDIDLGLDHRPANSTCRCR